MLPANDHLHPAALTVDARARRGLADLKAVHALQ